MTKSMRVVLGDLTLKHLHVVHPSEHTVALDESIESATLTRLIDNRQSR